MKTREAWNLKKFKMRRSRRHAGLRKFNFLLSAKQTKQGKKNARWRWGLGILTNVARSLKPKDILKNPVCSGENLTGGTLKVLGLAQPALPCGFQCSRAFLQQPDSSGGVWTR